MVKKIVFLGIFLTIFPGTIFAGGNIDEKTYSAYKAFENYKMGPNIKEHSNEIVSFEGCAGDVKIFNCANRINMEIKYSGNEISGKYHYIEKKLTVEFKGHEDVDGNILLIERTPKNFINYQFQGKHDEIGIRGLWTKGGGKKQFALNVEKKK